MDKKLLIFTTLTLLFGMSVFIWQQMGKSHTETPAVTEPVLVQAESKPTQTGSTPSPRTSLEISDWKTYRNKEYGFELKYPPASLFDSPCAGIAWTVDEMKGLSGRNGLFYFAWVGVSTNHPPTKQIGCGDEQGGGEALPIKIYEGETLEGLISVVGSGAPDIKKVVSNIKIDGVNSTALRVSQEGTNLSDYIVYVPSGKRIFVFGDGRALPNTNENLTNQILSTFRILE